MTSEGNDPEGEWPLPQPLAEMDDNSEDLFPGVLPGPVCRLKLRNSVPQSLLLLELNAPQFPYLGAVSLDKTRKFLQGLSCPEVSTFLFRLDKCCRQSW